jgi:mRNA-degrading endonuclease RelE of RelBE toxin-antitoxin system
MGLRLADYPHYRLTGSSEFRIRVGDYRVIYQFEAQQNEISVLAVGKRDKIYKSL